MEKDQLSRKLAVILHADVVGSTALVQVNETIAHQRIHTTFQDFSNTIKSYGGNTREIRGDALVAEFERASDAVAAAVIFQIKNIESNAKLVDDIRPSLRIGISLSEVVIADNTITGAGVVLAQRLEQLANPDGVVVQGSVSETVPARMPFDFNSLGEQVLKGFDQPVRAYSVSLRPGEELPKPEVDAIDQTGKPLITRIPETPPPESLGILIGEGVELPDKPSIAVLPFTNMSDDPEQEYFSDGITEDITTALAYFSGLFVIARNSSFTYKNQSVDARQVASELGVRYLLEGSVRRSGNHVRINSQLINAITGSHIWAERFDGDLNDIFELQDEITRKIVGSIAPQIELSEVERIRGLQPTSLSSYELSLQAKSQAYEAFLHGDARQLQGAINIAESALKHDVRNTNAMWIKGIAQFDQYLYRWVRNPDEALKSALQTAENLILVDSSNADGYGLRGILRVFLEKHDLAQTDFDRALSLNPNSVINLFFSAWGESVLGETTKAKEHAHLGLRLSPRERDIWLGVAYLALTQAHFAEEDFEEAMKWGRLAIQMHAKAPLRRALMVASCAYTGRLEEAADHAGDLEVFSPEFIPDILRGEIKVYKMTEQNNILIEGLRKADLGN